MCVMLSWLLTLVLVILVLISVLGNTLVCVAVKTDNTLRKLSNLFLVSLALADLFVRQSHSNGLVLSEESKMKSIRIKSSTAMGNLYSSNCLSFSPFSHLGTKIYLNSLQIVWKYPFLKYSYIISIF